MFLEIALRRPPTRNDFHGQKIVCWVSTFFFENLIQLKLTIKHVFHCESKTTHKNILQVTT